MLVVMRKSKQKYIIGSGFIYTASKFLKTHKDTISNLAYAAGNMAKTATAAKQIYDVIKTKRSNNKINKILNDKSMEILQRLSKNI